MSTNSDEICMDVTEQNGNLCRDVFAFAGKNFGYVVCNGQIYFKGKEIAQHMEYENPTKALRQHIDNDEKKKLSVILGGVQFGPPQVTAPEFMKLTQNDKNTVYITEAGLYELIFHSKQKEAKKFKKHVTNVILPSIRQTGMYSTHNNIQTQQCIEQYKVSLNTSDIKSFYENNRVTEYDNTAVNYLGVIGVCNNRYLLKYGESTSIYRRDYYEHRNTFGEQFKIVHIVKADNSRFIEHLFEKELKVRNLGIELQFNGKNQKELFVTSDSFDIEDAIYLLNRLVDDNPPNAVIIAQQVEQEIKKKKLNIENKKLELKKMECELELKKTELELIKEKKIANMMNNDYTVEIEQSDDEELDYELEIIEPDEDDHYFKFNRHYVTNGLYSIIVNSEYDKNASLIQSYQHMLKHDRDIFNECYNLMLQYRSERDECLKKIEQFEKVK
jgi:prophage antirepressor-like protein